MSLTVGHKNLLEIENDNGRNVVLTYRIYGYLNPEEIVREHRTNLPLEVWLAWKSGEAIVDEKSYFMHDQIAVSHYVEDLGVVETRMNTELFNATNLYIKVRKG